MPSSSSPRTNLVDAAVAAVAEWFDEHVSARE
jgi:hypothetical protein